MTQVTKIVIVRHNALATFGRLARTFADAPDVRLIWDRRLRNRRREAPSAETGERRRSDRRRELSATWAASDYVVVSLP